MANFGTNWCPGGAKEKHSASSAATQERTPLAVFTGGKPLMHHVLTLTTCHLSVGILWNLVEFNCEILAKYNCYLHISLKALLEQSSSLTRPPVHKQYTESNAERVLFFLGRH